MDVPPDSIHGPLPAALRPDLHDPAPARAERDHGRHPRARQAGAVSRPGDHQGWAHERHLPASGWIQLDPAARRRRPHAAAPDPSARLRRLARHPVRRSGAGDRRESDRDLGAGQRLKLHDEMEAISFAAIMRVVFGEHSDDSHAELRRLIPEMMDRCDSPFTLMPWFRRELAGSTPYARLMRVLDKIDRILFEVIAERRADPMTQFRDDTVSLLLKAEHEDGSELDDREIRDEILTMIMAGYETTTSGSAWALERLLSSPDQLARLTAEVEGGAGDSYMDAVVKETLRARPVVPVVARHVTQEVELGGYTIPAGSILMVSIYLVHSDPESYPEPDQFRPERFLDGVPQDAAWIPFGGGVRRCLGARFAELEMKVVLTEVLATARLRAVGKSPEGFKRKRFTFAPEGGAAAEVEALVSARSSLGTRRFRRRIPQVTAPHA